MPQAPTNWIHVALVLSTALCIGLTIGLFPALLSLNVEAMGHGSSANGLLAAMHGLAGLIVGPFVPKLMAASGALRTYIGSIAVASAMAVMFIVFRSFEAWFLLRFLMGLGLGVQWIVSETLMNQVAIGPRRGMIISLYILVLSVGMAIGPMVMAYSGTSGPFPFLITAGLLAASFLPLVFLPIQDSTSKDAKHSLKFIDAVRRKPSAMLAGAMDGFIFQGIMTLLPIYFLRLGSSETVSISMLNAFFVGGVVMQIGVGYLIDRFAPAKVLVASCAIIILALAVISIRGMGADILWAVMFLIGGPSAAIFTAGLASVNDEFATEEMSSGTAAFTTIWHCGGLAGPVIAGAAMSLWDPFGLTAVLALSLVILAVVNIASLRNRKPVAAVVVK